jgi:hypothetical protein
MKTEVLFWFKVMRNGAILAGMYFFSVWATVNQLDFLMHVKPIVIFFATYCLAEAGKRYGIEFKNLENRSKLSTFIF